MSASTSTSASASLTPSTSMSSSRSTTSSATGTASASATTTETPSASSSRSMSVSTSRSISASLTLSRSGSASATASSSRSSSLSASLSASVSGSASVSTSISGSGTTSATGSASATRSGSGSASSTESGTTTGSVSGSHSASQTLSLSMSQSVSWSRTTSDSSTMSLSPSASSTASGSASGSSSLSLSSSLTGTVSLSMTASATVSASVTSTITPPPTPTVSKSVSMSDTASSSRTSSSSLSGTCSLSPSVSASPSQSVSGTPSLTTSPSATASPSASLSASGSVSVSPSVTTSPSDSMSLTHSLSSSPTTSQSMSPSLSATPSVSTTPSQTISQSPTTSASDSDSISPTVSSSPSVTSSASLTASRSATQTDSETYSLTASTTHTPPPTPTRSISPSQSHSNSITTSLSSTTTGTTSVSASTTASGSVSSSPTATMSMSPSYSMSPSMSISPSTSPSATPSLSPSPSVSQSTSTTNSETDSHTHSKSKTLTPPPSPSRSSETSMSESHTASLSATITPTITPPPTPSPTYSATMSGTEEYSESVSPYRSESPSDTVSPSSSLTPELSLSPTASDSLSISNSRSWSQTISVSATASLSPTTSTSPTSSDSNTHTMSKSESFSTTQVYTPFDFMAWLLDGLNCAAVLYGALPPMFAIIGVAIGTMLVFLLVQRCYQFYRDPYSDVVRREPWRAPVPFWRCLIVHHVYASVLFPCGPRCCIVHAAECTVHVGVLMACTAFGYWKMAPVTEFMSASEERSLQGGIVLLALLLRLVYVRPGWLFRWVPVAPEHLYPDEPMPSEWAPTEPPSIQSPNNSFASVTPTKECGTPEEKEVSFSSDIELDDGLMLAVQNGPDFADPPPQDNKLPTAPSTSSGARSQVLDFDLVIDDDLIFRPREEPDIELLDPSFSGTFDQNGHRARSDQDDPLALHRFGVVDTAAQRDELVRTKTTNELRFGANLDDIEEVGTQHKRASVWALPSAFTPPEDDLYGSPIKRLSTFSAMGATPPSEEAAARTTISTTPTFDVTPLPKNQDKKGSVRAGAPPAEFRSTNASQLTLSNIDLQTTRSFSVVRLPPAAAPDVRGQRSATLGDTLTSAPATKSGDSSTKTVVLHVEDIPTWTNDLAFDDEDLAFDTSTGVATVVAGVGGGGGARLKPRGRHTPPAASLDRRHTNLAPSDVATRRATLPEGLRESPPPAAQRRVRIAESHADSIALRGSTDQSARRATLSDNKASRRKSTGVKLSPGSASLSPSEATGGGTRCLDVNRDNSRVIELSGFTEDIAFGDDVFEDDDEDADLDGNERGGDADGMPRLRSKSVFLGKPPPLFGVDATVHPNQLVADDSPTKASKQRDDRHQELFARVLANGEANPLLEPQDPTLLHNAQVLVSSRFTEEMRFDEDALDDGAEGAPDGSGGLPVETRDPARLQRERAYSTAARVKLWDTAVYATEGGPDDSRVDGGAEHEEDPQDDGGGVRNAMEHTNSHRRASVFHNATFRSIASVRADAPFHLDIDVDDVLRTNTKREAWLDAIEVHSEEISDGEQQTTRKQQQTTQQQRRKSSLWTTDMAFADLDGGEQDVCSNQDVSIVVDASAVDPHNHRRADLYTHDAAMLYDDLFENDDMAGIAFPLGATAASMYGAERRHQDAKVKMDQVFADAPFTDQMAFDDLDIDDDLVVVDMEEPHPSDKIDALVPGTSAAKYRMTRGASLKVLHDDGATVVSRRATFGHHPAAMDALDEAVALEGSTIMDTSQHAARNRRATFGHHPAAAFAASEDKMGGGDAAWAWGDAISDNGSYRLDLDDLDAYALGDDVEAASVTFIGDMDAIAIPELVLEFHPVYTNHIAYCVYLAILFVLAFMLANLFGIEQRRDEYGQCASYKSDFLQVLLIWDLIFGQALYCLLYFLCRIAWAWPRRVHWNVHPTNGGMVACFRKECHQCWQQRAQRTRRDHYDDFEALDPYWAQALEEPIDPMDRTQSKPMGNDDGTAFAVLDVDSDDEITIVKK